MEGKRFLLGYGLGIGHRAICKELRRIPLKVFFQATVLPLPHVVGQRIVIAHAKMRAAGGYKRITGLNWVFGDQNVSCRIASNANDIAPHDLKITQPIIALNAFGCDNYPITPQIVKRQSANK